MLAWPPGRPIRIGHQPPFAVPPERRSPARRLRGRLVAPVTVWTAGRPPGGAGLTVSSILVAEGEPARLLGLIDPTSAFWEAMRETGTFVVHVLAAGDRHLAERFSEIRPPIRGPVRASGRGRVALGPSARGEPSTGRGVPWSSLPAAGQRAADGSEPAQLKRLISGTRAWLPKKLVQVLG
jgi:hypothetical protein